MTDEIMVAEPVTAHRTWRYDIEAGRLRSQFGVWDSAFLEARCFQYDHESPHLGPVPDEFMSLSLALSGLRSPYRDGCLCGINAYKLGYPLNVSYGRAVDEKEKAVLTAVGIVDLGGAVHEYENGYRAQYGRIMELTLLSRDSIGGRIIHYIERNYEVPVRVMTVAEYRYEWEATYGRDWKAAQEDQRSETGTPPAVSSHTHTFAGSGALSRAGAGTGAPKDIRMGLTVGEVGIQASIEDLLYPQIAVTKRRDRRRLLRWFTRAAYIGAAATVVVYVAVMVLLGLGVL